MTIDSSTRVFLGQNEIVEIRKGNVTIWQNGSTPAQPDYLYIENEYAGQNTITLTTTVAGEPDSTRYADSVQYSKDGTNWTTINFDTTTPSTITMDEGEKVYFRNNTGVFNYYNGSSTQYYTTFIASESHSTGGNIMTLLDYNNPDTVQMTTSGVFQRLFQGNTTLTDSSDMSLPATRLTSSCYFNFFNGCSDMVSGPSLLPATTLANYCYYQMYWNCSSLATAPQLPATTLPTQAYYYMFRGCSFVQAPEIPATTVGKQSCYGMFFSCASLTTPPSVLPALTVGEGSYFVMFANCTALLSTPELPATVVGKNSYANMFSGCSSLVQAPSVLPFRKAGEQCCQQMFLNCSSLRVAPELPATELAIGCYASMYKGCSSLVVPSELPSETAEVNCYNSMYQLCSALEIGPDIHIKTGANNYAIGMFTSCTKLHTVKCPNVSTWTGSQYGNWLFSAGTNATETLKAYVPNGVTIGTNNSGVPSTWTRYNNDYTDYFYVKSTEDSNAITITSTQTGQPYIGYAVSVDYSTDKVNWTTGNLDPTTPLSVTIGTAERLYFRNNTGLFNYIEDSSNMYRNTFGGTKNHRTGGDIRTLLNYSAISGTFMESGAFYGLFKNDTNLSVCSNLELPDMSLSTCCYRELFSGCTALVDSPLLPATNVSIESYMEMFSNCVSLRTSPDLPATMVYERSYMGMFSNCTALVNIPSELPAIDLQYCDGCYQEMYSGCTGIKESPILPATTPWDYSYKRMFSGCTNLSKVTTYADNISATNCLLSWVNGVSATGTFYNNGTATYTTGVSGIPTGWTEDTSNRFVFSNTVITNVGNDQAQLTSGIQINYTGSWDDGYFEVYNELDKNRSIHFSPSEISNGVLTASNLIQESSVSSLSSPATVTIYNSGTAVWTGSVNFTVVQ